jgi:LacI family gluconate utilization system Gnt-I transcriptional repressor
VAPGFHQPRLGPLRLGSNEAIEAFFCGLIPLLRNRGDVSEATRERVLEAARRLGYVPNKIAGALASQRVNLVGVIIPSLSNMVFPEVLGGISETLEDTGLQPVVGVTNYSPEREEAVLYEMLSWRPSGVILAGLEHTEAAQAMLARAGIPVVEIMDIDGPAIDSAVGISHRRAGRQMAEAIINSFEMIDIKQDDGERAPVAL